MTTASMGWKAHAALLASAGHTTAVPQFAASAYRLAAGELIWLGRTPVRHPRAVMIDSDAPTARAPRPQDAVVWRPSVPHVAGAARLRLVEACGALARTLPSLAKITGLAALIAGKPVSFPLDTAAAHVRALARAIDGDDAAGAARAAWPLLGLGPGLTPSGDDFVGGMLFARRCLGLSRAWQVAARHLVVAARERTHVIAAALLGDLAEGQSHSALHALVDTLAAGGPTTDDVRAVTAIGHSSGCDMLAGFIVGVAGTAAMHSGVA